jgi:hypothetical protein
VDKIGFAKEHNTASTTVKVELIVRPFIHFYFLIHSVRVYCHQDFDENANIGVSLVCICIYHTYNWVWKCRLVSLEIRLNASPKILRTLIIIRINVSFIPYGSGGSWLKLMVGLKYKLILRLRISRMASMDVLIIIIIIMLSIYLIQFNSIQFFILTCWLNSYKSQLQSQHKKINIYIVKKII